MYPLEATVSFGGLFGTDDSSKGNVPDGIWPLLQQPFRIVLTVKQAA